jgi:glutathione S-transferase
MAMLIHYLPSAAVTIIALIVYIATMAAVARARGRYKVVAPAVDGDPAFARIYRVQQNTLEQLVIFLPALWLFALTIGDPWAGLIGLVWPIGRILYARAYYRDAEKRGPGFMLTAIPSIVLLLGAIVGIVRAALVGS